MNLIVAIMVMISLQVNLGLFMDIHLLLGFQIVFPLMKVMQSLLMFVSRKDVLICDFILVIDICQTQLYTFHCDNNLSFQGEKFWSFNGLLQCYHQ
jgi:hypothetical protein